MRKPVSELVIHGVLPASTDASVEWLKRHGELFDQIVPPVTDEEACALVKLFGPDDCFGAAWSLLHLIETAPSWPIADCLKDLSNEWVRDLRVRAERAGFQVD
jgi:hypothetical protein